MRPGAARASNGQEVQYRHDTSGRLAQARTARTVWDYRYQAGLVAEVSRNGRLVHRFTYTPHGRLESERRADGRRLVYQVAAGPEGSLSLSSERSGTAPFGASR